MFYIFLLIVAFLYASVGHGGASGYLALMASFGFAPEVMRPTALMLNILVSLLAFVQYYRSGNFKWRLFLPFAIASIPAAFLGGLIVIDATIYKQILGVLLFFPVLRLLGVFSESTEQQKEVNIPLAVVFGAGVGLFSGMIGIGGGIILTPLLLLLRWANMKEAAAASALFIFVNSIAGLLGLLTKGIAVQNEMWLMLSIAFIGGSAGAYLGANKIANMWLKHILAVVLIIAAVKLLMV